MKYLASIFLFLFLAFWTLAQVEEEVVLDTGDGTLAGVLTVPEGCDQCDIILMFSGSGPNDRDGNSALGVSAAPFAYLSEGLAAQGVASLRFDKYFSGKSTWDKGPFDVRFDDFIDGFEAWLGLLLPDQRFGRIGILGHSQGALVGAVITARQPEVDFYISLAGPGKSMDKLIVEQVGNQMPALKAETRMIFDSLAMGKVVENVNPALLSFLNPGIQPFMASWMEYDPADIIAHISQPILIINGTEDIQTSAEEAELLHKAQPKAGLVIIENMNHILKEVEPGASFTENVSTYSDPDLPLHSELIPAIVRFLKQSAQ